MGYDDGLVGCLVDLLGEIHWESLACQKVTANGEVHCSWQVTLVFRMVTVSGEVRCSWQVTLGDPVEEYACLEVAVHVELEDPFAVGEA